MQGSYIYRVGYQHDFSAESEKRTLQIIRNGSSTEEWVVFEASKWLNHPDDYHYQYEGHIRYEEIRPAQTAPELRADQLKAEQDSEPKDDVQSSSRNSRQGFYGVIRDLGVIPDL